MELEFVAFLPQDVVSSLIEKTGNQPHLYFSKLHSTWCKRMVGET